jgi:putative ATP-dependent endonuclease of OLD family
MFLHRVSLENFRGLSRMEIRLDTTTVLIGENASGKSTLEDALRLMLGHGEPSGEVRFTKGDFPRDGGDEPIRIRLEFREREKGEWRKTTRRALEPALRETGGLGQVAVQVEAKSGHEDSAPAVEVRYLDPDGRVIPEARDTTILAELRRMSPFVSISGGVAGGPLTQFGFDDLSKTEFSDYQQISKKLVDEVDQLMRGRSREEKGLWAAGSGAQSLAPMLFFGSLLRSRGATPFDPVALPVVFLSEIEAHLHPSVMNSVWALVDSFPVQKIVTTYSSDMLAMMPLRSLRRLVRLNGAVSVYSINERGMSNDELRRVAYHIRARRGPALFGRCWLLVEGETEAWLLPELARARGYELSAEGVHCVEYAQCGVSPLLKVANSLGIGWHLLTDGDRAGDGYVNAARFHLEGNPERSRITKLPEVDIEHHLWSAGFEEIYYTAARMRRPRDARPAPDAPRRVIRKAIEKSSKPFLAVQVVEAVAEQPSLAPQLLAQCIDQVVRLARRQDAFEPDAA